MALTIKRIEEFRLSPARKQAVMELLCDCFPDYPKGRTYYKQLPDFRYLAFIDKNLAGHLAVDHRLVSIDGQQARVFGVVDLCVAAQFQQQKVATSMLQNLEQLARKHDLDFILLLTEDHAFYQKQGYHLVENPCRWLVMQNHKSLGVIERKMNDTLMVKQMGNRNWEEGVLDFLGYVF